jgi:hypothetical protein
MNSWKEAGKGRKQCPTCKVYVGVRTSKCVCGFSFAAEKVRAKKTAAKKNEKESTATTQEVAPYKYTNHIILSTPSGMCPVKLSVVTKPRVKEWAMKLIEFHLGKGEKLKPEALKYYVRHFHSVLTDEYHKACNIIDEIKDEVGLYV